jgi:hypothetical protein
MAYRHLKNELRIKFDIKCNTLRYKLGKLQKQQSKCIINMIFFF